jgi:ribosome-associated protein
MTALELKDTLLSILTEKKAGDITVIDVSEQTVVTDYFIICTGRSTTQVKAITENLEEKAEEAGIFAVRKEGLREARWVVLDYSSVIVHVFSNETRDFYALEKLWGKGENVTVIQG